MKMILKIGGILVAILLSGLSILLLKNRFPDGGVDGAKFYIVIKTIWMQVGFHCGIATFVWAILFIPTKKALLAAIGMWILIGTFYTTLELSMRYRKITAIDLLHSSDQWEPIYKGLFCDGGSVALGLANNNGEVIYLWASPLFGLEGAGPQHVFLQLNFVDPNAIEVHQGSDLEKELLSVLDNLYIYPYQEDLSPVVEDFNSLLLDRFSHINPLLKQDSNQSSEPTSLDAQN